jgi:hypothetical protein
VVTLLWFPKLWRRKVKLTGKKMKYRSLLLHLLILIVYGAVQCVWAADTTVIPSISLTGLYDDNVSFKRGNRKNNRDDETENKEGEDYIYAISPMIKFDYKTEINRIVAEAILNYKSYIDNDNLNALNQQYKLEGDSNFTELLTFFTDLNYTKDNTLESQLDEEGKVMPRQDRGRYDLKGGLFFNLTELIRVGGDYRYRQTNYGEEHTEDYNDDMVSFIYNQRLKNQLDTLRFRTSYAYREVRTHETNTYRMVFGWNRSFSETFNVGVFLGGRFTEEYTYNRNTEREKDETTGLLADFTFTKKSDAMRTELGYHRDQVYTAEAGAREVDSFNIGLDRNITERLKLGIDLRLYLTRNLNQSIKDDSRFYEVKPKIVYNLTEYHLLGLNYSYQHDYDDAEDDSDDKDADRNRVWLSLQFNFPKKL